MLEKTLKNIFQQFQILVGELGVLTKKIIFIEIDGEQEHVKSLVLPGIAIQGARLWFLIASCIIASIGLNTNSVAVVIGAMLISPLMGPILGLGFGLATTSKTTIWQAVYNLLFAVILSLFVATFYFIFSPFQEVTSEILSRTSPNLLDLLVAIAAAFAGVVSLSSNILSGAVPGVAIATAIMPPLCASAYGFAHADWKVAFGSLYLFLVNAVAITVVSYLLFKRMRFTQERVDAEEKGALKPAVVSFFIILVVFPLAWSLWDAWRISFQRRSVSKLVRDYESKLEIVTWQWDDTKNKKLILYNFKKADSQLKEEVLNSLRKINSMATLEIRESEFSKDMEELAKQIKTSQIPQILSNPKVIEGLVKLSSNNLENFKIMDELSVIQDELEVLLGDVGNVKAYVRSDNENYESIFVLHAKSPYIKKQLNNDLSKLTSWLQKRLASKSVKVQFVIL